MDGQKTHASNQSMWALTCVQIRCVARLHLLIGPLAGSAAGGGGLYHLKLKGGGCVGLGWGGAISPPNVPLCGKAKQIP